AIAARPEQLRVSGNSLEYADRSCLRLPDLAALAAGDIHHANRPRQGFAARCEHENLARRRDARERYAGPVGRPRRVAIEIDARIEIAQSLRGDIVHANEAVIAPGADECQ